MKLLVVLFIGLLLLVGCGDQRAPGQRFKVLTEEQSGSFRFATMEDTATGQCFFLVGRVGTIAGVAYTPAPNYICHPEQYLTEAR